MDRAEPHAMHPTHARAWELLPWYLSGTLDAVERDEVQRHLRECLLCARELRRLEHLCAAVAAPHEEHTSARAFARLTRHIEARGATRSWPRRALGALRGIFEPVPLVAGASLLVVSALITATIVISGDRKVPAAEHEFQTLGQQRTASSGVNQPLLRIVLRDEIGAAGRAAWLARHDAELVDGPSAIGVLTVRVAMGTRTFDNVLETVRADQATLFAQPVTLIGMRPDRQR